MIIPKAKQTGEGVFSGIWNRVFLDLKKGPAMLSVNNEKTRRKSNE